MDQQESTQPTVSAGDRVMNVFASPAEAFDGLGSAPSSTSLWLVPMLISMLMGILSIYLLFSNPSLKSQLFDMQAHGMEQMVKDGKMTQAQADQARESMEGVGLGLFMVFGSVPVILLVATAFFGGALFLWLSGKFILKSDAGYKKYLEVYGLASWIGVLGGIVTMAMMIAMDSFFARPAASLAILSQYDPFSKTHKILAALDVFAIWQAVVVGIGLSKLSQKSSGIGIGVALALWVVWVLVTVFLGFGR